MSQTPEAQSFLQRVQSLPKGPGVSLDDVLQPSLDDETELRKLFATEKQNTRLNDKHVGLVDVFDAPGDIRTIRARVVKDEEDLSAKYVMPLLENERKKEGEPCMVSDLEEFRKNWSVFTEGSLSQLLDWNNVVAAGGSVLACLTPLPEEAKASKRAIRKYYHNNAYPTSDVDLFLYGMTPEQAEVKITKIYEAVRDSVPWDVTCVRTKHTVSIHSQYPYRSVQIVLRLYNSPAEILAGFDIDSACFAYDGTQVWGNPRSIVSMMRQCNTVDMTRRSPSYEVRLAKYSSRQFEVYVPTLKREDVDPTIYERSITRVEGLARLLVFEKLKDADSRYHFLESRRTLRGRPNALNRYARRKKQLKGDLKANMTIGGLEMNDYDVVSLHIPYGPGWDARRIEKLVYQTDLGMNSPFNPKNKERRLHRHPAFFGTAEECLVDCCEFCPDPVDEDERKLQKEEDEQYIRGHISFIEEDPGRQSLSGSFKPIDVGEWSEQVYIGPMEKFFAAIVANDRAAVARMIEEGIDVTRRDHVGRMPLHVAIMAKREEIAYDLIENGARITSRLADGRTALHLAAKLDMPGVVQKLLERSKVNAELLEKEKEGKGGDGDVEMKDATVERPSSEDDWSSDNNGVVSMDEDADEEDLGDEDTDQDEKDDEDEDEDEDDEDGDSDQEGEKEPPQTPEPGGLPEDKDDEPDVFDVNAPDWDLALTPLDYAILFASMPVINVLLDHEDLDLSRTTKAQYYDAPALVPLTVTMYREDEKEAVQIVERLVAAGASSSTADDNLITILSKFIHANKTQLVLALLRVDPKAASIINFPAISSRSYYNQNVAFPLNYAVSAERYAIVAALLAYGAKTVFDEKDVTEALTLYQSKNNSSYSYQQPPENRLDTTIPLIENALANHSDLISLLVPVGAPVDAVIAAALGRYVQKEDKLSLLDWAQVCIDQVNEELEKAKKELSELGQPKKEQRKVPKDESWKSWCLDYLNVVDDGNNQRSPEALAKEKEEKEQVVRDWAQIKTYLTDVERLLVSRKAKSYNDLRPDDKDKPKPRSKQLETAEPVVFDASTVAIKYEHMDANTWGRGNSVPQHQVAQYEELFEACLKGDNATIQRLCSQPEGDDESGKSPIQITVKIGHPTNEYSQTGLTPLSLAVAKRHWETARLIFTISAAQYKPDGKEKRFKINLEGFHDDSDDEGSDNDSEASDDTINQAPIDLVDIAKRSTKVQVPVPPSRMLHELSINWRGPDGSSRYASNLITAAVSQQDVQAFTNIINLYKLSDPPVALSSRELDDLLATIISTDQPEMLHEFIRKTGKGVTVSRKTEGEEEKHEEEEVRAVNDKNKVYYGLNVHGKKRKDLAAKNDPNATEDGASVHPPLLWRATVLESSKIVDYLKTERPLEAYRYYAMCNSDELAISLRRTSNLDKVLPQWLGWTINSIGESPLSAAILSRKLKMVKQMFGHDPKLMSSALKEDIKFIGFNLLMVAIHCGCTTKMVDFLLSNGLNPAQTDSSRGWNIYHILAGAGGDFLLFQHFLKKLPRDVSEALLVQQSKKYLDTPLHLAVENGRKDIVEAIINFNKSSLTMRSIKGSLPLHIAVLDSRPEIAKLLLEASPTEVLHSENGVGDTPIEIATSQHLLSRVVDVSGECSTVSRSLGRVKPKRFDVERLEKDTPELRKMIASLLEEKKLTKDSQLEKELSAFARYIETHIASAKPEYEARRKRDEEKSKREERDREEEQKKAGEEDSYIGVKTWDTNDRGLTFKYVKEAVDARPSERKLVHLVDVQKSVLGDLSEVPSSGSNRLGHDREDDGLEPEEQKTRDIPDTAMIFNHFGLGQILS
ncbi:hypothetical protein V5O48_007677 [Marasmius crinis-equi]|uniref:Ankyrin repeat protein n=1 Tax=Marasmius crinis-equi TaxID=585013 RepID=A0ABR3FG38_9AGAR